MSLLFLCRFLSFLFSRGRLTLGSARTNLFLLGRDLNSLGGFPRFNLFT